MLFSSDVQSTRAAAALADVVTSDLTPDYRRRLNVEGQAIVPGMVALLGEEEASGVRCASWRGRTENIEHRHMEARRIVPPHFPWTQSNLCDVCGAPEGGAPRTTSRSCRQLRTLALPAWVHTQVGYIFHRHAPVN